MSKLWFITGAGSRIEAGTVRAAWQAGDRVAATGRNLDKVRGALHEFASDNLAFVPLDIADEMHRSCGSSNRALSSTSAL